MQNLINLPIIIYKYPELNNLKIKDELLKYLKDNSCCYSYPNCTHPKYQSAPNLFDLNNKEIKQLKKYYFNCLKKQFNKFKIIENKSWVFLTESNKEISSVWHNHFNKKFKGKNIKQISGICYITKTPTGTCFENNYFFSLIKPHLHHWYIFDSNLHHCPLKEVVLEKRIIIATSTIIELNPKTE